MQIMGDHKIDVYYWTLLPHARLCLCLEYTVAQQEICQHFILNSYLKFVAIQQSALNCLS